MLESIDGIDWGAFSQPDWNGRDHLPLAIRALAGATTETAATEAYHRLLYALGNDHAGTYYPVVLPVVPFMQEIVERGTEWARIRALDILIDLLGSFEPESGFEIVRNPDGTTAPLVSLLRAAVTRLEPSIKRIAASSDVQDRERELAGELVSILTEATQ